MILNTLEEVQEKEIIGLLKYEPKRLISASPAWIGHLPFANFLVKKIKPEIIVELGTHTGNSLCGFAQAVKEANLSTTIYGVDTWQGDKHAGTYAEDIYQTLNKYVAIEFPYVKLLRMMFDEALVHFENESVDLLHIDGLHTYDAVKHDFTTWLPKVKQTGIIIFHDTQVQNKDFGVFRFWEEIKQKYTTFNFPHSNGLGVLFMPQALNQVNQKELFDALKNDLFSKTLINTGEYLRLSSMEREGKSMLRYKYIAKTDAFITLLRALVWKTWSSVKGDK